MERCEKTKQRENEASGQSSAPIKDLANQRELSETLGGGTAAPEVLKSNSKNWEEEHIGRGMG